MFSLQLSDRNLLKSLLKEVVLEVLEETKSVDSQKENDPSSRVKVVIKDEFLTRNEVSQMLKVSLVTLNNWQKSNTLTPFKVGKRVLYKMEDVEKAMQEQKWNSNIQKI